MFSMKVPQWAESGLCARVSPFICTWCVATSASSPVNPFRHLSEWWQTSETFRAALQTFAKLLRDCRHNSVRDKHPASASLRFTPFTCIPGFPEHADPIQPSPPAPALEVVATTAQAARYLTAASPEAPEPCWECFWLTVLKTHAHTPASVSHGLLGLWLSSETCFAGEEVGNGEATTHTVNEHHWRQTVQWNWVFLPLLFPARQDFKIWQPSCKQHFP